MTGNNKTHQQNFEQLECWKACRDIRLFITRDVSRILPPEEKFRLTDQLIRSARSTTANIAEGDGRFNYLDNARFCRNSRGSCKEVLDHLITASDEGLISERTLMQGRQLVERAVRLLSASIRYLINAKHSDS